MLLQGPHLIEKSIFHKENYGIAEHRDDRDHCQHEAYNDLSLSINTQM